MWKLTAFWCRLVLGFRSVPALVHPSPSPAKAISSCWTRLSQSTRPSSFAVAFSSSSRSWRSSPTGTFLRKCKQSVFFLISLNSGMTHAVESPGCGGPSCDRCMSWDGLGVRPGTGQHFSFNSVGAATLLRAGEGSACPVRRVIGSCVVRGLHNGRFNMPALRSTCCPCYQSAWDSVLRSFVRDPLATLAAPADRNGLFLHLFLFFRVTRGVDSLGPGLNRITVNSPSDKARLSVAGGSIPEWVLESGRHSTARRVLISERSKCEKLHPRVNETFSRYKKLHLYHGFLNWKSGLYSRALVVRVCLGGESFLSLWNGVCQALSCLSQRSFSWPVRTCVLLEPVWPVSFSRYLLLRTHQLSLDAFLVALKFMQVEDVDIDEVQCILANLIYMVCELLVH